MSKGDSGKNGKKLKKAQGGIEALIGKQKTITLLMTSIDKTMKD